MKCALAFVALLLGFGPAWAELPKPLITGLKNPESAAIGPGGKIYVSVIGEFDKDGDGGIMVIEGDKAVPFATGMDDPKGIAVYQQSLFVTDKNKIWKVEPSKKMTLLVPSSAFLTPPIFLNDIVIDPESGIMYVTDSGDLKGKGGAVYRITPQGLVSLVIDVKGLPEINLPNGLAMDGASHILMADAGTGFLYRIRLADNKTEKLAEGFGGADGVIWDHYGHLFVSDWKNGKVFAIPRPGEKPILIAEGFQNAADICLDATGRNIIVPDMKGGTLTIVPIAIPGYDVDRTPMAVETAVAFPDLKWTDWKRETDSGKPNPFRPLILTHAGDGSNRNFVATQQGVIHAFPNEQSAQKTSIFLDIRDRVAYNDNTNEEGFLGLAFHPKFKENGEIFVFYTPKKSKLVNVVSRFKLSKDDPSKADPASEEELIRFEKPFWNHDGGTICFGPDGYLYITHGDGGAGSDPFENGQKLSTLLGKILRIDVDHKDEGKKYAIPKDNPFVGKKGVLPEIWAYGFRNIWRMSFDRKTGKLWAADVGQNLWEEIDLVQKGGNYGWFLREGLHPFGPKGVGPSKDLIEPIWEYHHDIGKSITGGTVYRGSRIPDLEGKYIYGDYVTNKLWALGYDETKGRVTSNRPIKDRGLPVFSFGEDEKGEIYFLTSSPTGKGIYWFAKK